MRNLCGDTAWLHWRLTLPWNTSSTSLWLWWTLVSNSVRILCRSRISRIIEFYICSSHNDQVPSQIWFHVYSNSISSSKLCILTQASSSAQDQISASRPNTSANLDTKDNPQHSQKSVSFWKKWFWNLNTSPRSCWHYYCGSQEPEFQCVATFHVHIDLFCITCLFWCKGTYLITLQWDCKFSTLKRCIYKPIGLHRTFQQSL